MVTNGNQGSTVNYEPNSVSGGGLEDSKFVQVPSPVQGLL